MKDKKGMKRSLAALTMAGLLCGTAVAASTVTTKMIEANYMGIKMVVDGVAVTPKDGNGNVVEPFASNGTTYLPVRAVAEALGKEVTWDGATSTIYVGDVPGQGTNWMQKLPPYQVSKNTVVYDGSDPREYFTVVGNHHTAGVELVSAYGFEDGYALWNTNLQYNSMTFTVGHVDGSSEYNVELSVYLDGNYSTSYDLAFDSGAKTVTVPLNRAANVKFSMKPFSVQSDGSKKYLNEVCHYGVYDISFS